jgi:hypothetical protein
MPWVSPAQPVLRNSKNYYKGKPRRPSCYHPRKGDRSRTAACECGNRVLRVGIGMDAHEEDAEGGMRSADRNLMYTAG